MDWSAHPYREALLKMYEEERNFTLRRKKEFKLSCLHLPPFYTP